MSEDITIMTTSEAAEFLRISVDTLRELCRNRQIPHTRIGDRKYIFTKQALIKWIKLSEDRSWG